jgi:hypothetical protein
MPQLMKDRKYSKAELYEAVMESTTIGAARNLLLELIRVGRPSHTPGCGYYSKTTYAELMCNTGIRTLPELFATLVELSGHGGSYGGHLALDESPYREPQPEIGTYRDIFWYPEALIPKASIRGVEKFLQAQALLDEAAERERESRKPLTATKP